MKVVITNTVLSNGGDAAILLAIVQQVKRIYGSATEIVVADSRQDRVAPLYPELNLVSTIAGRLYGRQKKGVFRLVWGVLRFANWYIGKARLQLAAFLRKRNFKMASFLVNRQEREVLDHYATADLVISTGGTYLVDHYWFVQPLFELKLVRILGKPIVLFSQSIGPFATERYHGELRALFTYARLILLRVERSEEALERLCGPLGHAHLAPDVVIGYRKQSEENKPAADSLNVAISVRYWPYFKEQGEKAGMKKYLGAIKEVVRFLVDRYGATITFISTCQGIEGYTYDDSEIAAEVVKHLPDSYHSSVRLLSNYHRPEDIITLLSGFDLVLATRMHMAILSLVAGTPVIPIAYEFKTRELVKNLNLESQMPGVVELDIETLTFEALRDIINAIYPFKDDFEDRFFSTFDALQVEVDHSAERMLDIILAGKRGKE